MTDLSQLSDDELMKMLSASRGSVSSMSDEELLKSFEGRPVPVAPVSNASPQTAPDAMGRMRAAAAGVNRGAVNLAGLPVDTMLNMADLAKAVYGTVGRATGFLSPEQMPNLIDRGGIPGSSAWLANKLTQAGAGPAIENPYPQDTSSQLLHAGLQAAVPILFGGGGTAGPANTARNVGMGALGNVAAETAAMQDLPPSAQLLAQMGTQAGAAKIGQYGQAAREKASAIAKSNEIRDQNVRDAQALGYKFSPMNVNPERPSLVNRIVTGIGQKTATEQGAALANVRLTDSLIKKYVGIPETEPLTRDSLVQIRKDAGLAYDVVKQIPAIPVNQNYIRGVIAANNSYLTKAQGNRSLASKDAEIALQDAMKPSFRGEQAVELVKELRAQGHKNVSSSEPKANTTGKVQLKIADSIDNLIKDYLRAHGAPEDFTNYMNARKQIARSYTVEEGLNPGTGHFDAGLLRAKWKANKIPLQDEALAVAKAATVAPQELKQVSAPNPGMGSMLGWMGAGGAASAMMHDPKFLALQAIPLVRPAMRKIALSGPYQRAMVRPGEYGPGLVGRIAPDLFNEDMTGLIGAYAAPYQR